jgi:hypothetical protein
VTVLAVIAVWKDGGTESRTTTRSILNVDLDASDGNDADNAHWLQDHFVLATHLRHRKCNEAESNPGIWTRMHPFADAAGFEEWVPAAKYCVSEAISSCPIFALVKRDSQMQFRPPIGAVAALGFFNLDFTLMLLTGEKSF